MSSGRSTVRFLPAIEISLFRPDQLSGDLVPGDAEQPIEDKHADRRSRQPCARPMVCQRRCSCAQLASSACAPRTSTATSRWPRRRSDRRPDGGLNPDTRPHGKRGTARRRHRGAVPALDAQQQRPHRQLPGSCRAGRISGRRRHIGYLDHWMASAGSEHRQFPPAAWLRAGELLHRRRVPQNGWSSLQRRT
jgi:hypothetical protein